MRNRIRSERALAGLTQTDLAAKMNVSRDTVSSWENGGAVSVENLAKMAAEFNCSLDWLAGLSETRK